MHLTVMRGAVETRHPRPWLVIVAFVVVVVAAGSLIGIGTAPDRWYHSLAKPPFNPPNWVFAPIWFALYVLIGLAGALVFLRDSSSLQMLLWVQQMVLNWVWAPVWFTLHLRWPAFAVIIGILLLTVGFVVASWNRDRLAAWLFVPYVLWVAFSTSLNLSVALLN